MYRIQQFFVNSSLTVV